jgi:hypothetical protein
MGPEPHVGRGASRAGHVVSGNEFPFQLQMRATKRALHKSTIMKLEIMELMRLSVIEDFAQEGGTSRHALPNSSPSTTCRRG